MSNLVGLAALALMWGVVARLVCGAGAWVVPWLVVTGLCAVVGGGLLFVDSSGKRYRDLEPGRWLGTALGTVVLGGVFLLADVAIAWTEGRWDKPGVSFWNGLDGGGLFGFGLTFMVCPLMTTIFLAGAARSGYQRWARRRGGDGNAQAGV